MAVRMVVIRLLAGYLHDAKNNQIRGNIRKGVNAIHQQGLGVKKSTTNDFYDPEYGIENHSDNGHARGRLHFAREVFPVLLGG